MTHENTARNATSSAVRTRVEGFDVCLDINIDGLPCEQYLMTAAEAKALAEELLKTAGVKFKIVLNA